MNGLIDRELRPLAHASLVKEAEQEQVLWGRVKGYPYWPAQVLSTEGVKRSKLPKMPEGRSATPVMFFGTREVSWLSDHNLLAWRDGMEQALWKKCKTQPFRLALQQVADFLARDKPRQAPFGWWCEPPPKDASLAQAKPIPSKSPKSARTKPQRARSITDSDSESEQEPEAKPTPRNRAALRPRSAPAAGRQHSCTEDSTSHVAGIKDEEAEQQPATEDDQLAPPKKRLKASEQSEHTQVQHQPATTDSMNHAASPQRTQLMQEQDELSDIPSEIRKLAGIKLSKKASMDRAGSSPKAGPGSVSNSPRAFPVPPSNLQKTSSNVSNIAAPVAVVLQKTASNASEQGAVKPAARPPLPQSRLAHKPASCPSSAPNSPRRSADKSADKQTTADLPLPNKVATKPPSTTTTARPRSQPGTPRESDTSARSSQRAQPSTSQTRKRPAPSREASPDPSSSVVVPITAAPAPPVVGPPSTSAVQGQATSLDPPAASKPAGTSRPSLPTAFHSALPAAPHAHVTGAQRPTLPSTAHVPGPATSLLLKLQHKQAGPQNRYLPASRSGSGQLNTTPVVRPPHVPGTAAAPAQPQNGREAVAPSPHIRTASPANNSSSILDTPGSTSSGDLEVTDVHALVGAAKVQHKSDELQEPRGERPKSAPIRAGQPSVAGAGKAWKDSMPQRGFKGFQFLLQNEFSLPPDQYLFHPPKKWLMDRPPKYECLRTNIWLSKKRPKRAAKDEVHICACSPPRMGVDGRLQGGCGEECLNRISYIHCDVKTCPCGENCANKPFHRQQGPKTKAFQTDNRGWGVKALESIKKGSFIIEYAGEVIDEVELAKRMEWARLNGEPHFYIMEMGPGLYIDARRKGNLARLLNSSCDPNCETQKWHDAATGEVRVGIFATRDIGQNEELTYDYFFQHYGNLPIAAGSFQCMCGAKNCRGTMDVQPERRRDLGRRIEVFWDGDGVFYRGTIQGFHPGTKRHTIMYDDGDTEKVLLDEVPHRWLDDDASQLTSPVSPSPPGAANKWGPKLPSVQLAQPASLKAEPVAPATLDESPAPVAEQPQPIATAAVVEVSDTAQASETIVRAPQPEVLPPAAGSVRPAPSDSELHLPPKKRQKLQAGTRLPASAVPEQPQTGADGLGGSRHSSSSEAHMVSNMDSIALLLEANEVLAQEQEEAQHQPELPAQRATQQQAAHTQTHQPTGAHRRIRPAAITTALNLPHLGSQGPSAPSRLAHVSSPPKQNSARSPAQPRERLSAKAAPPPVPTAIPTRPTSVWRRPATAPPPPPPFVPTSVQAHKALQNLGLPPMPKAPPLFKPATQPPAPTSATVTLSSPWDIRRLLTCLPDHRQLSNLSQTQTAPQTTKTVRPASPGSARKRGPAAGQAVVSERSSQPASTAVGSSSSQQHAVHSLHTNYATDPRQYMQTHAANIHPFSSNPLASGLSAFARQRALQASQSAHALAASAFSVEYERDLAALAMAGGLSRTAWDPRIPQATLSEALAQVQAHHTSHHSVYPPIHMVDDRQLERFREALAARDKDSMAQQPTGMKERSHSQTNDAHREPVAVEASHRGSAVRELNGAQSRHTAAGDTRDTVAHEVGEAGASSMSVREARDTFSRETLLDSHGSGGFRDKLARDSLGMARDAAARHSDGSRDPTVKESQLARDSSGPAVSSRDSLPGVLRSSSWDIYTGRAGQNSSLFQSNPPASSASQQLTPNDGSSLQQSQLAMQNLQELALMSQVYSAYGQGQYASAAMDRQPIYRLAQRAQPEAVPSSLLWNPSTRHYPRLAEDT